MSMQAAVTPARFVEEHFMKNEPIACANGSSGEAGLPPVVRLAKLHA